MIRKLSIILLFTFLPFVAQGEELNAANTAWILSATALVLFMTLPGLALFYGGLVRSKNILSILMQCFAIAGISSILWVIIAYSIAFDSGTPYFGGLGKPSLMALQKALCRATYPNHSLPCSR